MISSTASDSLKPLQLNVTTIFHPVHTGLLTCRAVLGPGGEPPVKLAGPPFLLQQQQSIYLRQCWPFPLPCRGRWVSQAKPLSFEAHPQFTGGPGAPAGTVGA